MTTEDDERETEEKERDDAEELEESSFRVVVKDHGSNKDAMRDMTCVVVEEWRGIGRTGWKGQSRMSAHPLSDSEATCLPTYLPTYLATCLPTYLPEYIRSPHPLAGESNRLKICLKDRGG